MTKKELNLDEILRQLSVPRPHLPDGLSVPTGGSPVIYGSGCKPPEEPTG